MWILNTKYLMKIQIYTETPVFNWDTVDNKPPLPIPLCGLSGELCKKDDIWNNRWRILFEPFILFLTCDKI